MKSYTHVLYHGNCYDGFGAALCAWLAQGGIGEYIPVLYGQDPPALPVGSRVLIVDFSYPREMLVTMAAHAELQVLDHHVTAEAALAGLPFAHFDLAKSGAVLAFEHFWPEGPLGLGLGLGGQELWVFCQYLQDRDLWKFALPHSREVSAALRSYPFDFGVWAGLVSALPALASDGEAVLRHQDQMVMIMCDQSAMVTLHGHVVPAVNATVFFSEVGDELCRRFPGAPFAAYYLDRADGKRQWGLRSRNGFDTTAVAKAYGGGGHPGASGFTTEAPDRP